MGLHTEIRNATRITLTVAITVQPAGVLVCLVILITGRASGRGARRNAAMMLCNIPRAIRGRNSTPSMVTIPNSSGKYPFSQRPSDISTQLGRVS